jgi:hypothetical protein
MVRRYHVLPAIKPRHPLHHDTTTIIPCDECDVTDQRLYHQRTPCCRRCMIALSCIKVNCACWGCCGCIDACCCCCDHCVNDNELSEAQRRCFGSMMLTIIPLLTTLILWLVMMMDTKDVVALICRNIDIGVIEEFCQLPTSDDQQQQYRYFHNLFTSFPVRRFYLHCSLRMVLRLQLSSNSPCLQSYRQLRWELPVHRTSPNDTITTYDKFIYEDFCWWNYEPTPDCNKTSPVLLAQALSHLHINETCFVHTSSGLIWTSPFTGNGNPFHVTKTYRNIFIGVAGVTNILLILCLITCITGRRYDRMKEQLKQSRGQRHKWHTNQMVPFLMGLHPRVGGQSSIRTALATNPLYDSRYIPTLIATFVSNDNEAIHSYQHLYDEPTLPTVLHPPHRLALHNNRSDTSSSYRHIGIRLDNAVADRHDDYDPPPILSTGAPTSTSTSSSSSSLVASTSNTDQPQGGWRRWLWLE